MKQEILYKGKRPLSGKWIKGFPFKIGIHAYILSEKFSSPECSCEVLSETFCQFIFSANGHSFFQNDILKREKSNQLWVIVWNEEVNNFSCLTNYEYRMLSNPDQRQFVFSNHSAVNYVWILKNNFFPIGNIFDNPELLEAAN